MIGCEFGNGGYDDEHCGVLGKIDRYCGEGGGA